MPPRNAGPGRREGRVWAATLAREEERPTSHAAGPREEEKVRSIRLPQSERLWGAASPREEEKGFAANDRLRGRRSEPFVTGCRGMGRLCFCGDLWEEE